MPGTSATAWTLNPSVQYHPHSQAGSVTKTGSVITACPDLRGLAALAGDTVAGPIEITNDAGVKFWRFNGAQYATLANSLTAIANRGYSVAMVVRMPHQRGTVPFLVPRYATYASDTSNTPANASIRLLAAVVTSSGAPGLTGSLPGALTDTTNGYKAIPGCQLQVVGVASRTTANGGTRYFLNNDTVDVAQATSSVTGYIGAIIGGAPGAVNTANVTVSVNNVFDLYELAYWQGEISNANMVANIAAMVTNWSIAQLDTNLLLEGDSITDGIATTLATSPAWSTSVGAQLCKPGASLVPSNVRVLNLGTSGSQVASIITRRDATNPMSAMLYPGGPSKNIFAAQIGRNDVAASLGNQNSAQAYASIVTIFNTTTTGYLQRGWKCYFAANIGTTGTATTTNNVPTTENTTQKRIEGIRALVANTATHTPQSQFLTDTLSNTSQTFDGLMSVLHLYDISQGGTKWFNAVVGSTQWANAVPAGPYDNDSTHPVEAGHALMASGGDTPQYGFASVFATAVSALRRMLMGIG